MLRTASISDAEQICRIYNHYILTSVCTFEQKPVEAAEMVNRINDTTKDFPWIVCEDNGIITGYAYAGKWKTRTAYDRTVESTVYIAKEYVGKGIGKLLYTELIHILHRISLHSIIGIIALPNAASIALHEKIGFKKVAHLKEVGWKFDRWIDVGYWQLML